MSKCPNNIGHLVSGAIRPFSPQDRFPVLEDKYLKGGLRVVETLAERDQITSERRSIGMRVFVIEDGLTYEWKETPFLPVWALAKEPLVERLIGAVRYNPDNGYLTGDLAYHEGYLWRVKADQVAPPGSTPVLNAIWEQILDYRLIFRAAGEGPVTTLPSGAKLQDAEVFDDVRRYPQGHVIQAEMGGGIRGFFQAATDILPSPNGPVDNPDWVLLGTDAGNILRNGDFAFQGLWAAQGYAAGAVVIRDEKLWYVPAGDEATAADEPGVAMVWRMLLDFRLMSGIEVALAQQIQVGMTILSPFVPVGRWLPLDGLIYQRDDYPELGDLFPNPEGDLTILKNGAEVPDAILLGDYGVYFREVDKYLFGKGSIVDEMYFADGDLESGAVVLTDFQDVGRFTWAFDGQGRAYFANDTAIYRASDHNTFELLHTSTLRIKRIRIIGDRIFAITDSASSAASVPKFVYSPDLGATWEDYSPAWLGEPAAYSIADVVKFSDKFYFLIRRNSGSPLVRFYILNEDLTLPPLADQQNLDASVITFSLGQRPAIAATPTGILGSSTGTGAPILRFVDLINGGVTTVNLPPKPGGGSATAAEVIERRGNAYLIANGIGTTDSSNRYYWRTSDIDLFPIELMEYDDLTAVRGGLLMHNDFFGFTVGRYSPIAENRRIATFANYPEGSFVSDSVPSPLNGAKYYMFSGV